MAEPLIVALPKGRLTEDALVYLQRAGYGLPAKGDNGRKLVLEGSDGRLRFIMAKPADVPIFVEYGAADMGIVGLDVVREAARDVYEPRSLPFGSAVVVAGKVDRPDRPLPGAQPAIATKFPRLTERILPPLPGPGLIVMSGSVEPPSRRPGRPDRGLVQTGSTLRENGLTDARHPKPGHADRQPGELPAARRRSARPDRRARA